MEQEPGVDVRAGLFRLFQFIGRTARKAQLVGAGKAVVERMTRIGGRPLYRTTLEYYFTCGPKQGKPRA